MAPRTARQPKNSTQMGGKRFHHRIHVFGRTTTATPLWPWSHPVLPLRVPVDILSISFRGLSTRPTGCPSMQDVAHPSRIVAGSLASQSASRRWHAIRHVCPARTHASPHARARRGVTSVCDLCDGLPWRTRPMQVPCPSSLLEMRYPLPAEYNTYPAGNGAAPTSWCTCPPSRMLSSLSGDTGEGWGSPGFAPDLTGQATKRRMLWVVRTRVSTPCWPTAGCMGCVPCPTPNSPPHMSPLPAPRCRALVGAACPCSTASVLSYASDERRES